MHEVKAWLIPSDGVEVFVTSSVCALVLHTAAKANVEWRIVIAKLGWMNELEIDGECLNPQSKLSVNLANRLFSLEQSTSCRQPRASFISGCSNGR